MDFYFKKAEICAYCLFFWAVSEKISFFELGSKLQNFFFNHMSENLSCFKLQPFKVIVAAGLLHLALREKISVHNHFVISQWLEWLISGITITGTGYGEHVGCYNDKLKDRDLSGASSKSVENSPQYCIDLCLASG